MKILVEWEDVSFIIASDYRLKILKFLSKGVATPSSISEETDIRPPHVSRALRKLTEKRIVECVTPDKHKGKIYKLTNKGSKILQTITKEFI